MVKISGRIAYLCQLTGVINLDGKVYPYLYNPGREHVSGDETTGDEDVSGDEISGDEISGAETSGAETSGAETNHSSVVSSINSNQESGSDSSSSSDDDDTAQYQIEVQAQGAATHIVVNDAQGKRDTSSTAKRILSLLEEELR